MRRVLAVAIVVVIGLLAGCSDDSSSGDATTTTAERSTTTKPKNKLNPKLQRYCDASTELFEAIATIPVESLGSLRSATAEAVQLLGVMEANAPGRLEDRIILVKAAAVRMDDSVNATDDLSVASGELAELQTPAVTEAAEVLTLFADERCKVDEPDEDDTTTSTSEGAPATDEETTSTTEGAPSTGEETTSTTEATSTTTTTTAPS